MSSVAVAAAEGARPLPGTRVSAPGAAGAGGWLVGTCVPAWEFPQLCWGTEVAWSRTGLLPA